MDGKGIDSEVASPVLNNRGKADFDDAMEEYNIAGVWLFNPRNQTIARADGLVHQVRAKTCDVLALLIRHHDRVVTTEEFFDQVWEGRFVGENVLKRSIFELRHIFEDKSRDYIATAPKRGYRLKAAVALVRPDPPEPETMTPPASAEAEQAPSDVTVSPAPVATIPTASWYSRLDLKRLAVGGFFLFLLIWGMTQKQALRQAQEDNLQLQNDSAQMNRFMLDMLARYKTTGSRHESALKAMLDEERPRIDQRKLSPAERLRQLRFLAACYLAGGHYADARMVLDQSVRMGEEIHGQDAEEVIRIKFALVETLVAMNERQAAYDTARYTLDLIRTAREADKELLAHGYYWMAMAQLECIYPYCDRPKALASGKQNAEAAMALFSESLGADATETGDALWLLNWFVTDSARKVEISRRALDIYQANLGELDEKTAAAYAELSRTLATWGGDLESGERYMLKALAIRQKLYPENHYQVGQTYRYLGEQYMFMNQPELAAGYFVKASTVIGAVKGAGDPENLEALMWLAKANLYREKWSLAESAIAQAMEIIASHQITPPYYLLQEMKAVEMRVKSETLARESSLDELMADIKLNRMLGLKAKNTFATAVVEHEYQTLLLRKEPGWLDETRYIDTFNLFLDDYLRLNRYFVQPDLQFVASRSMRLCRRKSEALCGSLMEALQRRSLDLPEQVIAQSDSGELVRTSVVEPF
ncbi:DNA-binding winged-HTH domains [Hahella chejuensis KCTC 2396]|uniref:DNA-binding winged-HTH domains n=1 Tax=Hahella chejuensis (strain KCTC 2396) TaxID=349521 RepID=Q2S7R1_HAHCH|nr:winged helix-turn-helix domain-containing protein [Hahella chejuensis]ABC33313.1 DNA-binding winged-HTH domains [Hahella chejuensis KCTC 2396]